MRPNWQSCGSRERSPHFPDGHGCVTILGHGASVVKVLYEARISWLRLGVGRRREKLSKRLTVIGAQWAHERRLGLTGAVHDHCSGYGLDLVPAVQ